MTDRELLEKAARAAGITVNRGNLSHERETLFCNRVEWNPLEDDGDAFRLAVSQVMSIHRLGHKVAVVCDGQFEEYIDDDPARATRRAVVRAAAAMGGEA